MRVFFALTFMLPLFVFAQTELSQSITIKRKACFGTCPVYSMTVFSDGVYFWYGEEYVSKIGYLYGKFGVNKFEKAVKLLASAKYQDFKDRYSTDEDGCKEFSTDNPSVQLVIQLPAYSKEIYYYYGCGGFPREAELQNLVEAIDGIFETKKFVGKR